MGWLESLRDRLDKVAAEVNGEARKALEAEVSALKAAQQEIINYGPQMLQLIESAVSNVQPAGTGETVMKILRDFTTFIEQKLTQPPVPDPAEEPAPAPEPAPEEDPAPAADAPEEPPAEEPAESPAVK